MTQLLLELIENVFNSNPMVKSRTRVAYMRPHESWREFTGYAQQNLYRWTCSKLMRELRVDEIISSLNLRASWWNHLIIEPESWWNHLIIEPVQNWWAELMKAHETESMIEEMKMQTHAYVFVGSSTFINSYELSYSTYRLILIIVNRIRMLGNSFQT